MGSGPFKYRIEGSLRLTAIHEVLERAIKEDVNYYLYQFGVEEKGETSHKLTLEGQKGKRIPLFNTISEIKIYRITAANTAPLQTCRKQ